MEQPTPLLHAHVLGAGSRPPLLILHGLFGSGDNWLTLGRRFAQDRPVHLLDLRNHGRSFHSDVMSLEAMAEDLERYRLHHALGPVSLLGHSLGGKVAMHYALSRPQALSSLLVADIAPRAYAPRHQLIFEALQAADLRLNSRAQLEAQLARYLDDVAVRRFLMKNAYRPEEPKTGFQWRFNLPVLARDYETLIGALHADQPFKGPVLFIRAERSDYVTAADEPLIKQYFPQAHIETLPHAGHWLHAEQPAEFYRKAMGLLGRT